MTERTRRLDRRKQNLTGNARLLTAVRMLVDRPLPRDFGKDTAAPWSEVTTPSSELRT
jgi:hypothetical protein